MEVVGGCFQVLSFDNYVAIGNSLILYSYFINMYIINIARAAEFNDKIHLETISKQCYLKKVE